MVMQLKVPQYLSVFPRWESAAIYIFIYLHNLNQLFLISNRIKYRGHICFNSQYEQLFTLTLAYKLGLEHDVIFSDIV